MRGKTESTRLNIRHLPATGVRRRCCPRPPAATVTTYTPARYKHICYLFSLFLNTCEVLCIHRKEKEYKAVCFLLKSPLCWSLWVAGCVRGAEGSCRGGVVPGGGECPDSGCALRPQINIPPHEARGRQCCVGPRHVHTAAPRRPGPLARLGSPRPLSP